MSSHIRAPCIYQRPRGAKGFVLGGNGVSCPRPLAYKKKTKKRFTVIKGQIKAHNGDIDFFSPLLAQATKKKKKRKNHVGEKPFQVLERDMISLFREDNMESSPRMNFERSKL